MSDKAFLDTNIIIYLYSEDEKKKRGRSESLLQNKDVLISTQVLNEFASILRKKFQLDYTDIIRAIKELSENMIVVQVQVQTIFSALELAIHYGYSYYDSLIIASAKENDCTVLYSEDMQHDQVIEQGLKIINPYLIQSQ